MFFIEKKIVLLFIRLLSADYYEQFSSHSRFAPQGMLFSPLRSLRSVPSVLACEKIKALPAHSDGEDYTADQITLAVFCARGRRLSLFEVWLVKFSGKLQHELFILASLPKNCL